MNPKGGLGYGGKWHWPEWMSVANRWLLHTYLKTFVGPYLFPDVMAILHTCQARLGSFACRCACMHGSPTNPLSSSSYLADDTALMVDAIFTSFSFYL